MNFIIDKQYHNKIRIVGTTASVINACFDASVLPDCCDELEKTYNARILGEFEFDTRFLAEPNIEIWLYDKHSDLNNELQEYQKLFEMCESLDQLIKTNTDEDAEHYYKHMLNIFDYLTERPTLKPEHVKRIVRDLLDVQHELGIFPAYILAIELLDVLDDKLKSLNNDQSHCMIWLTRQFLVFIMKIYTKIIQKFVDEKYEDHVMMLSLATPKLLRLLDIINYHTCSNPDFLALVFVDRVLFSYVISKYVERLASLTNNTHIKPNFFVGNNNDYQNFKFIRESVKNFENTIKDFKNRNYNLLITTSVLEEGIDIGRCSLVIRFSEPATYREFVQSKGRARAQDSIYVIMQDKEDSSFKNSMDIFKKTEKYLNYKFKKSKQTELRESILPEDYQLTDQDECIRSKTGSLLAINQAGQFIQRYIMHKGNKDFKAEYSFEEINLNDDAEPCYRFKLNLQGVTPLVDEVVGKVYPDQIDAFKSACLAACKALYDIGQLDDHFIPISDETVIKRCNLINSEYTEEEIKEMNYLFDEKNKQR